MRLILASLVILGHVPFAMGREHEELLTRIYPRIGFGAFAVDLFFVISGYLIVGSFLSHRLRDYFAARILRIYPGFIVAYVLSYAASYIWGPGAKPALGFVELARAAFRMIRLEPPIVPGLFPSVANGAMWTISYEFRCYLLVALIGVLGGLRHRYWILGGTVLLLALQVVQYFQPSMWGFYPALDKVHIQSILGGPANAVRLTGIFACGACFRLFRDRLPLAKLPGLIAAIATPLLMLIDPIAEIVLATVGGYALFWFAFQCRSPLMRFNNRNDLSYGVYLYGWPAMMMLIWYDVSDSIAAMVLLTLAIALCLGAVSWFLIEKPSLGRLKRPVAPSLEPAI